MIQILIARLLGPAELGIYAFVFAINELLHIVGAFSLGAALIQSREESQRLYDTALVMSLGLAGVGLLASLLIAPLLWVYHRPEAAWFLLAMALARVAQMASRVPNAQLERTLRYGPLSVISVVTSSLPNLLALALAALGVGAWSLVVRDVLAAALVLVLTQIWSAYRFGARLDREAARRLMDFARPMFWSRSLDVVLQRVDRVAVGAAFGDAVTGLYHQARFLSEAGLVATRPVTQLSFNLFARVQDEPGRRDRSFALIQYFLVRIILAGAVVLLVTSEEVLRLLLGPEWLPAAPLLRGLGVYAATMPVLENLKMLFLGVGEVVRNVRIRLVQLLCFAPGVAVASWQESIAGVAAALVASTVVGLGLAWHYSADLVARPTRRLFGAPLLAAGMTLVGCGALAAVGVFPALPWMLRPLIPPLLYGLLLLVLERSVLLQELRYLRAQLRQRPTRGAVASEL